MKRLHPSMILCAALLGACERLKPVRQVGLSLSEKSELERRAQAPEEIGIRLEGNTAHWQERLSPPGPVTARLLPPESSFSCQPVVSATINGGEPMPMVLDTGAPLNLIHAAVALERNLKIANPRALSNTFVGIAGEELAYYGIADEVLVGQFRVRNMFTALRTQAAEVLSEGDGTRQRWEGNLLGFTTLSQLSYLTIDYLGGTVTFSVSEPFQRPSRPGGLAVAFTVENQQLWVEATLDGGGKTPLLVDTGNEASFMLKQAKVEALNLELFPGAETSEFVGLGGAVSSKTYRMGSLMLGKSVFENIPVAVAPDKFPDTVGSGFLRQFKVTFDFLRNAMWLEK